MLKDRENNPTDDKEFKIPLLVILCLKVFEQIYFRI